MKSTFVIGRIIMTKLMKNIPNIITLLRVVLSVLVNLYIANNFGKIAAPIIITFIIFLTDFLDGKIARAYKNAGTLGATFDVLADLFYIVTSYMLLWNLHILPLWFLFIILVNFLEFVVTSYIIKNNYNTKLTFTFDLVGRLVAVIFYIPPIFSYVSNQLMSNSYSELINAIIYITTVLIFISALYRIGNCVKGKLGFVQEL